MWWQQRPGGLGPREVAILYLRGQFAGSLKKESGCDGDWVGGERNDLRKRWQH